jgi:hypothetical protein
LEEQLYFRGSKDPKSPQYIIYIYVFSSTLQAMIEVPLLQQHICAQVRILKGEK